MTPRWAGGSTPHKSRDGAPSMPTRPAGGCSSALGTASESTSRARQLRADLSPALLARLVDLNGTICRKVQHDFADEVRGRALAGDHRADHDVLGRTPRKLAVPIAGRFPLVFHPVRTHSGECDVVVGLEMVVVP